MGDENDGHEACVAAWLERAGAGLPAAAQLDLLEQAFEALWARVRPVLGDVTLGAIAGRVVHDAAERFLPFRALEVRLGGLHFEGLRAQVEGLREGEFAPALRSLLVDFLTVLGHLTAEVLTPALHVTLAAVGPAAPVAAGGGRGSGPGRGSKKRRKP